MLWFSRQWLQRVGAGSLSCLILEKLVKVSVNTSLHYLIFYCFDCITFSFLFLKRGASISKLNRGRNTSRHTQYSRFPKSTEVKGFLSVWKIDPGTWQLQMSPAEGIKPHSKKRDSTKTKLWLNSD